MVKPSKEFIYLLITNDNQHIGELIDALNARLAPKLVSKFIAAANIHRNTPGNLIRTCRPVAARLQLRRPLPTRRVGLFGCYLSHIRLKQALYSCCRVPSAFKANGGCRVKREITTSPDTAMAPCVGFISVIPQQANNTARYFSCTGTLRNEHAK